MSSSYNYSLNPGDTVADAPNGSAGSAISGTWTVTYNDDGTVTTSDVDITVTSPDGTQTTTFTSGFVAAADGGYRMFLVGDNSDYSANISWTGTDTPVLYTANAGGFLESEVNYKPLTSTDAMSCFLAGTLITTPSCQTQVEALQAGDLVTLSDGRTAPICWLGRQTVSTRFADPLRVLPIRIKAGALAENTPARDLLISPDHAILIDNILVQAGALVNGVSIFRETNVPETFVYYHVEVADHSLILAEGVAAETFVDNVDRLAFDNWAEHEAIAGADSIEEMPYARAKSHRQVPIRIRRMLSDRATPFEPAKAA